MTVVPLFSSGNISFDFISVAEILEYYPGVCKIVQVQSATVAETARQGSGEETKYTAV